MRYPLLSIIIPTLNSEAVIVDCLNSILSQTYTDYEILVLDSLSSDSTMNLISKFSETNDCIRVISEKDNGIYDAMNKGIKEARGKYLYFLGSDDKLFAPDVLAKVAGYLTTSNLDVLYGDVISRRFQGRYAGIFSRARITIQNICHQSIFLKKTLFDRHGLYNTKFKVAADWDFNIKWFFDPLVKYQYADLIIADFSADGTSAYGDKLFTSNYRWEFVVKNRQLLTRKERVAIFLKYSYRYVVKRQYQELPGMMKDFLKMGV